MPDLSDHLDVIGDQLADILIGQPAARRAELAAGACLRLFDILAPVSGPALAMSLSAAVCAKASTVADQFEAALQASPGGSA